MKKGQTSIEFLFSTGIIILIFLILIFFVFSRSMDVTNLKKSFDKKEDCLKIAKTIDEIYFNQGIIMLKVNNNFILENNRMYVDDEFCDFIGFTGNKSLSKGDVIVEYLNNKVEVRNA